MYELWFPHQSSRATADLYYRIHVVDNIYIIYTFIHFLFAKTRFSLRHTILRPAVFTLAGDTFLCHHDTSTTSASFTYTAEQSALPVAVA